MTEKPLKFRSIQLSKVSSDIDIPLSEYAIKIHGHCPLDLAYEAVFSLETISTLIVGTAECSYYTRMAVSPHNDNTVRHWTYTLEDSDVVFGCEEGLRSAIRDISAQGVEYLAVLVTCIPHVISDDIEAVVSRLRDELPLKILYLSLPHFKTKSPLLGLSEFYRSTVSIMEPTKEPQNMVNMLGRFEGEEYERLKAVIERSNYRVNLLDAAAEMGDFILAPSAKLNLVFSDYMLPMAEKMKQGYGIDYIDFTKTLLVDGIENNYQKLDEHLKTDCARDFKGQQKKLIDTIQDGHARLSGVTYTMLENNGDSLVFGSAFSSVGMVPVLLHVEAFKPSHAVDKAMIVKNGVDPWVFYNIGTPVSLLLSEAPCQLLIGGTPCERMTIPHLEHLNTSVIGYEKAASVIKQIIEKVAG